MSKLKRGVFTLMALVLVAPAIAPVSIAMTGAELAKDCANYPETPRIKICELYVSEILEIVKSDDDLLNPLGRLCPASDVPLADVIGSINKWLVGHPELRQQRAYKAIYGALRRDFPCR
jgi:hypothetical protein